MQLLTTAKAMESAASSSGAGDAQNAATTSIDDDSTPASTPKVLDRFYPPKPKISAFNELLQCSLCQGYMINPTTIDVCIHTYCRSCIIRHLAVDCFCPQCKGQGGGGGARLTIANLKPDDTLRSIIFKLVPGLYQSERERLVQFVNNTKQAAGNVDTVDSKDLDDDGGEWEDSFFSPTDAISLSLEYHPVLAQQAAGPDAVPPVRYLQCPASVKVQHLRRFLGSKFDIEPTNKQLGIEIIYEDEVLPSDFTLMDICYCYGWKRNAPLQLFYRILVYSDDCSPKAPASPAATEKVSSMIVSPPKALPAPDSANTLSLNGSNKNTMNTGQFLPPPPPPHTKAKTSKSSSSRQPVAIAPKPAAESKKSVSKRSAASIMEDVIIPPTNDFKSLRSNDIRYSQYTVVPSTPTVTSSPAPSSYSSSFTSAVKTKIKQEKPPKCDVVVSIPHNQMHEEWDSTPLSHLKNASKKSPHSYGAEVAASSSSSSSSSCKKVKNVPKLKIELNSLKTKLIEKPKSADIRLDSLLIKHEKPRKFSLDDFSTEKVDLETYAKNIGLKPIEMTSDGTEAAGKFTPNASPRSSCSTSTNSSGNGLLNVAAESSKSHKKRKKKHSKDSKDSKRKKLHAEISSHGADESLKMKVKLTTPLSIKPSKLESKKSPSVAKLQDGPALETAAKSLPTPPFASNDKLLAKPFDYEKEKSCVYIKEKSKSSYSSSSSASSSSPSASIEKKFKETLKLKPLTIKSNESAYEFDDDDALSPDTTTSLALRRPLSNLKDPKLSYSPPGTPGLFKAAPVSYSNFSVARQKPLATPKLAVEKPSLSNAPKMKPLAPKPMPPARPSLPPAQPMKSLSHFAVPNPPRLMACGPNKFPTNAPNSIASSVNRQLSNSLKRSISLDDHKPSLAKQSKADRPPHQITVSTYGSNLQVNKVDVLATPTSSTANATYEIPLYSPLCPAYNLKSPFTVNSSSSSGAAPDKSSHAAFQRSSNGNAGSKTLPKLQESHKMEKDNLQKLSALYASNATVMGPPMPVVKPGATTIVPTCMKSPPMVLAPPNSGRAFGPVPGMGVPSCRPILAQAKAAAASVSEASAMNGDKASKSSLRQFRLPSRDSAQDILDLSGAASKSSNGLQSAGEKKPLVSPSSAASYSLEMVLTKIKQNMNSAGQQDGKADIKPHSEDLQNLHMLSESATAREKIAISSGAAAAANAATNSNANACSMTSASGSLYDKSKLHGNTMVRQQNASVRSIPNPSALAFRNQQPASSNPIPMVTIAVPLIASLSNDIDKSMFSTKTPASPISPSCSSSPSPPRAALAAGSLPAKKHHPSIDQVAASLNMRASAAAAAEATAKASLRQLDETALVSSTSSLPEPGNGSKLREIKQETPEQTTTTAAAATATTTMAALSSSSSSSSSLLPSSSSAAATTTTTASPSRDSMQPSSSSAAAPVHSSQIVVEIKQEPEDKFHDSSSASAINNEEPHDMRGAPPQLATSTTTTATKTPASKVDGLVTSVINVTTPTSTLLTASGVGGF